jgi:hypothetical protein
MITKKPRKRGAVYPIELLVRMTNDMNERMEEVIAKDPTETRVGLVRKALDKYLPKKGR